MDQGCVGLTPHFGWETTWDSRGREWNHGIYILEGSLSLRCGEQTIEDKSESEREVQELLSEP